VFADEAHFVLIEARGISDCLEICDRLNGFQKRPAALMLHEIVGLPKALQCLGKIAHRINPATHLTDGIDQCAITGVPAVGRITGGAADLGGEDGCRGNRDMGAGAAGRGFTGAAAARGVTSGARLRVGCAMLAVTSRALDLRSRISIRRRSGIFADIPSIASVSSVFTSCAPESGMIL
jgi:hypothetical protein